MDIYQLFIRTNSEEDSSDESLSLDLYAESDESDDDLCVSY